MKNILSIIMLLCVALISKNAAAISIAAARTSALGATVTVTGVSLNGNELGSTRYINDATGGIAVYHTGLLSGVQQGDNITVTGTLIDFNQLLEISITSVVINSSNNALPTPVPLSIAAAFGEAFESKLVRIDNVSFAMPGVSFVGSTNYTINQGTSAGVVRVNNASSIPGELVPCGITDVVGIMSQFNTTYQLLPRYTDDIQTLQLEQTDITTSGFVVRYTTVSASATLVEYGTTPALGLSSSNATLTNTHSASLTGLAPATLYYVRITNAGIPSCVYSMMTASNSSGTVRAYFNAPIDATVALPGNTATFCNNSIVDTIASYIDKSQSTLDIAIYSMYASPELITAIEAAYARGVAVRMLFDRTTDTSVLMAIGIPAAFKKYSPIPSSTFNIMHNKFVIIDANSVNNSYVLSGATNWSYSQLFDDKNNLIALQDQSLAKAYTIEFNEMYITGKHGSQKTNNTPHVFVVGGKRVESYFSPSDGVQNKIKNTIKTANEDLYFGLLSFTRGDIAKTISDSMVLPLNVFASGIVNDTGSSTAVVAALQGTINDYKVHAGTGSNIFHHKYLIVDPNCPNSDPLVLTGSHNWSQLANTKNDENTLIVYDSLIANQYYQEYNKRYKDLNGLVFNTSSCPIVGINESNIANQIEIYPNPASEVLFVRSEQGLKQIVIFNALGQLVQQSIGLNSSHASIEIATLPPGFYIVKVTNNLGTNAYRLVKE